MNKEILEEIETCINHFCGEKVEKINNVLGGCIHNALKIKLRNGQKLFAKISPLKYYNMLHFEAEGLNNLNRYINQEFITIPQALFTKKLSTISILVLPWMELGVGNEKTLGKGIAQLHLESSKHNINQFGWDLDGFIGTSPQLKGWMRSWGECFVMLRLSPQLKMAKNWIKDFNKPNFESKLINFLNKHQPEPSLVHGDLWKGNTAVQQNGKGIIFDPAVWWADREVDIAMTKLFGGFSEDFYKGYEEIWKLPASYEERIEIYNLYHLLNHGNMFGGAYKQQSFNTLKRIYSLVDKL